MTDYVILIEHTPVRRKTPLGDPQFAMRAVLSGGAGESQEIATLASTTKSMGFAYIAMAAYRFLAASQIDVTKTTIKISWKHQHDQAVSA